MATHFVIELEKLKSIIEKIGVLAETLVGEAVKALLSEPELADGKIVKLTKGMSYQVSDELSSHRTSSVNGVKLFVVDGDFLKLK